MKSLANGLLAWCAACVSIWPVAMGVDAAQDKPDFSGRWILVASARSDPSVAQSLTVRQPVIRTNVFGAPMPPSFLQLTVDREFIGSTQTDNYQIGVEGGTVGGVVGGRSFKTHVSVRWEGDRLLIETSSYSGSSRDDGPYREHREEWELDPAGM
jgi:hypothetical protein